MWKYRKIKKNVDSLWAMAPKNLIFNIDGVTHRGPKVVGLIF